MKNHLFFFVILLTGLFLIVNPVFAHKPRIVRGNLTTVENPEVSQAFYGELSGIPHTYVIESPTDFNLYVNLLVPKSSNPFGRYSAEIYRIEGDKKILFDSLSGSKSEWQEYYEEFAGDYYLKGPELRRKAPEGHYEIIVFSVDNRGKYVLAVGEIENFGVFDLSDVFIVLPTLKKDFFEVSMLTLLSARLGIVFILGILLPTILFIVLLVYVYEKLFTRA